MSMTDDEMLQMTLDHWKRMDPKQYKELEKHNRLMPEAKAAVKLTRTEMDMTKMVTPGMTDQEAWTEAREIFCITEPPEVVEPPVRMSERTQI